MTLKSSLPAIASAAIVAIAVLLSPAVAGTVHITSHDGKVMLIGKVVAVEDRMVTVQTEVGPLTFDYDAVSCDGAGCSMLALDEVKPTTIVSK